MIKPPIEELLEQTPGRFALVITAARREIGRAHV